MLNKLTKINLKDEQKKFIIIENQVQNRKDIALDNVEICLLITYAQTDDKFDNYHTLQMKLLKNAFYIAQQRLTNQDLQKLHNMLNTKRQINKYIIEHLGIDMDGLYNAVKDDEYKMQFEYHTHIYTDDIRSIERIITPVMFSRISREYEVRNHKAYNLKGCALDNNILDLANITHYNRDTNKKLEILDNDLINSREDLLEASCNNTIYMI